MKVKSIVALLGIILLVLLPIILVPRVIIIENISCSSQFGPCNSIIQNDLDNIKPGKLNVVKGDLGAKLSENVLVRQYSIQYKFPSTFEVNLLEAKPRYAFVDKEKNIILVDADGLVISSQKNSSLPNIEVEGSLKKVGEKLDEKSLFAGELIYDMFSLYSIDYGMMVADRLEVTSPDGIKIIFPLEGDKDVLSGSLVAIMSRLKEGDEAHRIEGVNKVTEIDLRYKNPVLR